MRPSDNMVVAPSWYCMSNGNEIIAMLHQLNTHGAQSSSLFIFNTDCPFTRGIAYDNICLVLDGSISAQVSEMSSSLWVSEIRSETSNNIINLARDAHTSKYNLLA